MKACMTLTFNDSAPLINVYDFVTCALTYRWFDAVMKKV